MSWHDLLFAHWRIDPARLRPLIPAGLELETFDGAAWLGVVPFEMRDTTLAYGPPVPPWSRFPELNVRTYVRVGDKPGVWFFSLDAARRLVVWGARTFFHLPYVHARMSCEPEGEGIAYASRRTRAEFRGRYRPAGAVFQSTPGSLESFLTERYALYSADRNGRIFRGDIDHLPWPLQPAEAEFQTNTMAGPLGIDLAGRPDHLVFARRLDVHAWALVPA